MASELTWRFQYHQHEDSEGITSIEALTDVQWYICMQVTAFHVLDRTSYTQSPAQPTPPSFGSQLSRASSTHIRLPPHFFPSFPPQKTGLTHRPGASQHSIPHGSWTHSSSALHIGALRLWPPQSVYCRSGGVCFDDVRGLHIPAQFSPRVHVGSVREHVNPVGHGAILKPQGLPVSKSSVESCVSAMTLVRKSSTRLNLLIHMPGGFSWIGFVKNRQ